MRPVPRRSPTLLAVILSLHARIALLGLFIAAPPASGAPDSYGSRQAPLAYSPEFGEIAFSDPGTGAGTMVVSTGEGVEVRLAASPGGAPVGLYRAPGSVRGIAARGTQAYLFQGDGGITLVHDEVMETARRVRGGFIALLEGVIGRL